MQKVTPFLWFDGNAEEAANFYISIFKNSNDGQDSRYGDAGPGPKGSAMSVTFQIEARNSSPSTAARSSSSRRPSQFFVNCETQQEVDDLWENSPAGGRTDRCGWLQDKFVLPGRSSPPVSANCGRQGSAKSETRHAGHAADDQDRYQKTPASAAEAKSADASGG